MIAETFAVDGYFTVKYDCKEQVNEDINLNLIFLTYSEEKLKNTKD